MTDIDFKLLTRGGNEPRKFKSGETIFNEGEKADFLYVVESGTVEVRLGDKILNTLEPGSIFGEMALIDNSPRRATAVASSDVSVIPVDEKQFLFLVTHTPYFALNVMRILAKRLQNANQAL